MAIQPRAPPAPVWGLHASRPPGADPVGQRLAQMAGRWRAGETPAPSAGPSPVVTLPASVSPGSGGPAAQWPATREAPTAGPQPAGGLGKSLHSRGRRFLAGCSRGRPRGRSPARCWLRRGRVPLGRQRPGRRGCFRLGEWLRSPALCPPHGPAPSLPRTRVGASTHPARTKNYRGAARTEDAHGHWGDLILQPCPLLEITCLWQKTGKWVAGPAVRGSRRVSCGSKARTLCRGGACAGRAGGGCSFARPLCTPLSAHPLFARPRRSTHSAVVC